MAPIPTVAENAENAAQQGAQGTGPAPAAQGAIGGGRNFAGSQRRIISELERINALNLEPSLPKVDDGNRSVSRHTQDRDRVKNEFQQFLTVMKKNDEQKAGNQQPTAGASSSQSKAGPPDMARSFSQPTQFQPTFTVEHPGPENKSMIEVLDEMLTQANTSVKTQPEPCWPEANGPSYHEVLGRPTGKPSEAGMNGMGNAAPDASSGFRPPQTQPQGQGHQGQHNNQQRPPGHDQAQQMRPMGPPGTGQAQAMQSQGQPPQGYMMAPQGQQGGQPQMMFMPGMGQGPQGMQQMQGMPMQQMQFGQQPGGQMMMMGPGGQMMMPMQMPGGQQPPGGQNPQGMGMQGGQMMVGPDGQQQQMMFMPMMMGQDGQAGQGGMMMMPQGMQGYGQGGQGNQQQGGYMMQQPMFQQQPGQSNAG